MQTAPLVTDHVTIDVLKKLFFSDDKPSTIAPVDMGVLAYLILRRSVDHEVYDSYLTIAERLGTDRKTVARSLERLDKLGWASFGGRGIGRTKALTVNAEKLPAAQAVRAKVTQAAKTLTWRYMEGLKKTGRSRFPKNWHTRQFPSAQRILTNCGGDIELAARLISHGLSNPKYKNRTGTSLYHALMVWPGITRSYTEKLKQQQTGEINNAQCSTAA
jgi:hypothetical protein